MILDSIVFLLMVIHDGISTWMGNPAFILVFFPLYLFIENRSLSQILFGAFLSVLLTEVLFGYWPGTFLIPAGIGVMVVHLTVGTLNWSLPPVQWLGSAGYLLILLSLRGLIVWFFTGSGFLEGIFTWCLSYLFFCVFLLVRQTYTEPILPGERLVS